MDYLGWELERQEAALSALLLGGEAERDGESAGDGERRSLAEPGTARRRAGGRAGRYAGGSGGRDQEALGVWETVRTAGRVREGGLGTAERPVSSWEEIRSAEEAGEESERSGRNELAGAEGGAGWESRGRGPAPLGGGTGAQAERAKPSGSYEPRREERRTAGSAGERRGGERLAAGFSEGGDSARTAFSDTEPGGGEAAGFAGIGFLERSGGARLGGIAQSGRSFRRSGPVLPDGGSGAGTSERYELPDIAFPWNGGRETAALRAENSARTLSRAVQRDARRYDGGFTIY